MWKLSAATGLVAGLSVVEKKGKGKKDAGEVSNLSSHAASLSQTHWLTGPASVCLQPNPPTPEVTFILARILFLMTVSPSSSMLELLSASNSILPCLIFRLSHPPIPMAGPDPTVELLKLTFNLLLHLPRLSENAVAMDESGRYLSGLSGEGSQVKDQKAGIGEWWDERLDA